MERYYCEKWMKNSKIDPFTGRKVRKNGKVFKQLSKKCMKYIDQKTVCKKWKTSNKATNPRTGRKISSKTGVPYKVLQMECSLTAKICSKFRNKSTHNPLTNRKLNIAAKNGQYKILKKTCNLVTEPNRNRLKKVLKKTLQPILHRMENFENRIHFARIIRKHLLKTRDCISKSEEGAPVLKDNEKKIVIVLQKRIGSESEYGIAFLNTGTKFGRLLKISSKIMDGIEAENKREVVILKKMSKLVENGTTPNMPITFMVKKCENNHSPLYFNTNLNRFVNEMQYFVVLNELADYDLNQLFFTTHLKKKMIDSIMMQVILAVYCFHSMRYIHNDAHLGNFLVHKVHPGGFWHYKIKNSFNVCVPNTGYLIVIWDPGLATYVNPLYEMSANQIRSNMNDYVRPLSLIYSKVMTNQNYVYDVVESVSNQIGVQNDFTILAHILNLIINDKTFLPNIVVNKSKNMTSRPGKILNAIPYQL